MDLFARYGPILNHHNINNLGTKGRKMAIDWINKNRAAIISKEKDRLGLNTEKHKKIEEREMKKFGKIQEKIKLSPTIMVPETGVVDLWEHIDDDAREFVENNVFLVGGREQQHILTDQEINTMIHQINQEDLLQVLLVSSPLVTFYPRVRRETARES